MWVTYTEPEMFNWIKQRDSILEGIATKPIRLEQGASFYSFVSLKWFRKVRVYDDFLIIDDKILSGLLNL